MGECSLGTRLSVLFAGAVVMGNAGHPVALNALAKAHFTYGLAEDLVIQCGALGVGMIVDGTVGPDPETLGFRSGIDVGT